MNRTRLWIARLRFGVVGGMLGMVLGLPIYRLLERVGTWSKSLDVVFIIYITPLGLIGKVLHEIGLYPKFGDPFGSWETLLGGNRVKKQKQAGPSTRRDRLQDDNFECIGYEWLTLVSKCGSGQAATATSASLRSRSSLQTGKDFSHFSICVTWVGLGC